MGLKVMGSCVLEARQEACGSSAITQQDVSQGPGEREFCQARPEHRIAGSDRIGQSCCRDCGAQASGRGLRTKGFRGPGTQVEGRGAIASFGLGGAEGSGSWNCWTVPAKRLHPHWPAHPRGACPGPQPSGDTMVVVLGHLSFSGFSCHCDGIKKMVSFQ